MQISAEIRWFWVGEDQSVRAWFFSKKPGGGGTRPDRYLLDRHQTELGIKERGGRADEIEVKGLIAECPRKTFGQWSPKGELWGKWSSRALSLGSATCISTDKTRWL